MLHARGNSSDKFAESLRGYLVPLVKTDGSEERIVIIKQTNSMALSPRANYTD
jgi:hypothetical protein